MSWFHTHRDRFLARRAARASGRLTVDAGMTLLEILIVLAIIGLIMGVLTKGLFSKSNDAKKKIAKTAAVSVQGAVELYMMDHSQTCPTGAQDLVQDGKIGKKDALDPWGKDFIIRCPGTENTSGVDVLSTGPDRQEGTPDDIKAWE